MSTLRDLLFHVQEHRFNLLQIRDCLAQLGLKFCGFEIEKVVSALQNKYSAHEFYKQIEKAITDSSRPLEEFLYSNTILVDERTSRLGFQSGRIFTGDKKIPQPIIERLKGKKWLHDFYIDRVKTLMKRDSTLIKLIEDEI